MMGLRLIVGSRRPRLYGLVCTQKTSARRGGHFAGAGQSRRWSSGAAAPGRNTHRQQTQSHQAVSAGLGHGDDAGKGTIIAIAKAAGACNVRGGGAEEIAVDVVGPEVNDLGEVNAPP